MIQEHTYSFSYARYSSIEELSTEDLALIKAALKARESAYAPYSDFLVGAAIQMADGTIHTGNNQENAAYPSGMCAERVALYHAASQYPDMAIRKIAVAGGMRGAENITPTAPCGACRQAILEYSQKQGSDIEIIFCGTAEVPAVKVFRVEDLLPFSFGADFLEK